MRAALVRPAGSRAAPVGRVSSRAGGDRRSGETGSAVAEFVMVLVMLMLLFLALIGIGLWAYSQSLLISAAAQAARYAANSDISDPQAASYRAAQIMADTIAGSAAETVRCEVPLLADPVMVEVTCRMAAPGILPILTGLMPDITVTAHALREVP